MIYMKAVPGTKLGINGGCLKEKEKLSVFFPLGHMLSRCDQGVL